MGYYLDELLVNGWVNEDSVPVSSRRLGFDPLRGGYGLPYGFLELRIVEHRLRFLPAWHR
jgi:hypothetical protein